jgi:hypothetical protein
MEINESEIRTLSYEYKVEPIEVVEFLNFSKDEYNLNALDHVSRKIGAEKVMERYTPFNDWLAIDECKFHAKIWKNLNVRSMAYGLPKKVQQETALGLIVAGLTGYYSPGKLSFRPTKRTFTQSANRVFEINPTLPEINIGRSHESYEFLGGQSIQRIIDTHDLDPKKVEEVYEVVIEEMIDRTDGLKKFATRSLHNRATTDIINRYERHLTALRAGKPIRSDL